MCCILIVLKKAQVETFKNIYIYIYIYLVLQQMWLCDACEYQVRVIPVVYAM